MAEENQVSRLAEHYKRRAGVTEARDTALDYIVRSQDLVDALDAADEQTAELLYQVYQDLQKRLAIDRGTVAAIQRLRSLTDKGKSWNAGMIRNQVFKAAHDLGIKLPSASF